jgi:addiction module RelE/StbE family toxin
LHSLIWDSAFKNRYKKVVANNPRLKKNFWEKMELFADNPYNSQLKTHKLSGKLKNYWALSLEYDCRVVFEFKDGDKILLIDIGSHNEVY